ncbi:hypothetical protein [Ignicoccus hospitalis]|uniref:Uncharacterized protein n=1 Tax=Ignicoccus hospitalis (strain KIN4/I / DSM 18386 / JCM 14125) TaxID=453591 RepID=A8A9L8_IGNH4|nr:hypothetical protein [Ignicoccus hospitalis]ABU81620.1 hypothetical protein Igni_0437 [Ignicoccus hospitalis KIN4/I]HIH89737.1 apolipoprotein A1/A4/E family protein [Desulfurococcaceae archaeon]
MQVPTVTDRRELNLFITIADKARRVRAVSLPDQLLDLAFQYASQKFAEILDKLRAGKPITDSEANFILLFMVLNQTKVSYEVLSKQIELNRVELREVEKRLDKRIDEVEKRLNSRIDETNKRIDEVKEELNRKIEDVRNELNNRIDETNRKIDQLWEEMKLMEGRLNKRIDELKEELSKRMDDIEQSMDELKAGMAGLNSQMKLVADMLGKVVEALAKR